MTVTNIPVPWCGPVVALNYEAARGFIYDVVYRRPERWEASLIYKVIIGLEEGSGGGVL